MEPANKCRCRINVRMVMPKEIIFLDDGAAFDVADLERTRPDHVSRTERERNFCVMLATLQQYQRHYRLRHNYTLTPQDELTLMRNTAFRQYQYQGKQVVIKPPPPPKPDAPLSQDLQNITIGSLLCTDANCAICQVCQ